MLKISSHFPVIPAHISPSTNVVIFASMLWSIAYFGGGKVQSFRANLFFPFFICIPLIPDWPAEVLQVGLDVAVAGAEVGRLGLHDLQPDHHQPQSAAQPAGVVDQLDGVEVGEDNVPGGNINITLILYYEDDTDCRIFLSLVA